MTYKLIETIDVGSGSAASIEFTGIPQDGKAVEIKFSGRYDTYASSQIGINLNSDTTTSNYSYQLLRASNTTVSGQNSSNIYYGATINEGGDGANFFSSASLIFPNYASSQQKTWSMDGIRSNSTSAQTIHLVAYLWTGTSPITSIKLVDPSGTIAQYSTASLYIIS